MIHLSTSTPSSTASLSEIIAPKIEGVRLEEMLSYRQKLALRLMQQGAIVQEVPELNAHAFLKFERVQGELLSAEEITPPPSFTCRACEMQILLPEFKQVQVIIPFEDELPSPHIRTRLLRQVDVLATRSIVINNASTLEFDNESTAIFLDENLLIERLISQPSELPLVFFTAKPIDGISLVKTDEDAHEPSLDQEFILEGWKRYFGGVIPDYL